MSSGSIIGQLSPMSSHERIHEWTWTIPNIFAYEVEDTSYNSPRFSIKDSEWDIQIYPNGQTKNNTVGWIYLFLFRVDNKAYPKCVNISFGIKKVCGTVDQIHEDFSWVFDEDGFGCGGALLKRSDLLQRKSELTSSGALTLTCSLSVIDETFESKTFKLDTLQKYFAELLISKKFCDATLKVQNREFPVHKLILSARSTVFAAMFETDMKEKETGFVDIVDCNPDVFQDFLTFLYSSQFRTDSKKVFELYKIADKYCVADLKSVCALYMMRHLTLETFCDAVVLGDQFHDASIKCKSKDFFSNNFGKIICTASWKSLLKSNSDLANELLIDMAKEKNL